MKPFIQLPKIDRGYRRWKKLIFLSVLVLSVHWIALVPSAFGEPSVVPAPSPVPALSPHPSCIHSGLSFGAGWPYAGLKYFFNDDLGAEARFATADNVYVYSLRGYWSFAKWDHFSFLGGLEAGYVTFNLWNVDNSLRISGTGNEFAPLFGTEYFLDRDFSLLLDFSMSIISLNSRNVNIGDMQWVLNGGLYFHPF